METYLARQTRRSNEQRARFLIDGWDDTTKPALAAIEKAAVNFLCALDAARSEMMRATDIAAIDALACDTAGGTIDVLNHLIATARRDLDDCDGEPGRLYLDLSVLDAEHAAWTARWNARKPPRFPEVSCSACGQTFGPGDNGFSHCKNHAHLRGK